jgi:hypothetical protein
MDDERVTRTSCYDFHGVRIDVVSEFRTVARQLRSRLRHFTCDSARPPEVVFRYTSRRNSNQRSAGGVEASGRPVYDPPIGRVLYDDAEDRLYIGYEDRLELISEAVHGTVSTTLCSPSAHDSWLASHPFFTLALLEQLKRRRLFGLHAALLSRAGRALVLPGASGAGKSTLTICLLRAGFAFGGDDLCFLRPSGGGVSVLAFPDELDVTEETVTFFPELSVLRTRPHRPDVRKWPLLGEEIYSADLVLECDPALLVFPRVGESEESRLEPLDPARAMIELVPNIMLTEPATSQAHLDAIGELVRRSRCYALQTGRDFDRLPQLLCALLVEGNQSGPGGRPSVRQP